MHCKVLSKITTVEIDQLAHTSIKNIQCTKMLSSKIIIMINLHVYFFNFFFL